MTMPTAIVPPPPTIAAANGPVQATLHAARRRLMTQRLLDTLAVSAGAAGGGLVVLSALQYFRVVAPHQGALLMAGTVFLAILAALTITAAAFPLRRWLPWRRPRALRYLAAPLLLGGGLAAYAHFHPYQPPRPTALDGTVARQADDLKKLAEQLRPKSPDAKTPELDKLTEELNNSARRLQDTASQPDPEKLKSALRELSSLEAMLRAMKDAAREGHSSPEEMAALTAALAANEPTRAAAQSLQSGDAPQAGAQWRQAPGRRAR